MVKKKKVVWDDKAKTTFKVAITYIRQDSALQAEKVKSEILEATRKLAERAEMHPPDKYRSDKDPQYRAFEKHSYRISYLITNDAIRILRLRHVRQEPKNY